MYKTSIWFDGVGEANNSRVYSESIRYAWMWAYRAIRNGAMNVFIHCPNGKRIQVY